MIDKFSVNGINVELHQGDITEQKVDAIINAANRNLQHGAGVAGAILAKGGDIIRQESENWVRIHGPVTFDHPAITSAGLLHSTYVIHAVGPVWGEGDETNKLELAVYSSLLVANDLKCLTVAFPAISTGIFGFPVDKAAVCFVKAIEKFARMYDLVFIRNIRIVLYSGSVYEVFKNTFISRMILSG